MPFCANGADGDDLLGIRDGSFLGAFEFDVALDELDGAIGAGADGLHAGAGEPVDMAPPAMMPRGKARASGDSLIHVSAACQTHG